jgi:hypothetical protein
MQANNNQTKGETKMKTTKMPKIQCKRCQRMVSIERAIGGRCNTTPACSARKEAR